MTDDIEKSNFNPQMLKSCTDTAYECGYRQGATDMEQAKQIIIDSLLKQIEQIRADAEKLQGLKDLGKLYSEIRADAIEEVRQKVKETFKNPSSTWVIAMFDVICEQLKEQE